MCRAPERARPAIRGLAHVQQDRAPAHQLAGLLRAGFGPPSEQAAAPAAHAALAAAAGTRSVSRCGSTARVACPSVAR